MIIITEGWEVAQIIQLCFLVDDYPNVDDHIHIDDHLNIDNHLHLNLHHDIHPYNDYDQENLELRVTLPTDSDQIVPAPLAEGECRSPSS